MADRIVLDSSIGIQEALIHDSVERKFHIHRSQDVESILDDNAKLRSQGNNGYGESREWKHVARIPLTVIELWSQLSGVDVMSPENSDLLLRYINDPNWSKIRTSEGIV